MRHSSSNFRLFPVYNVFKDQYRFICGNTCEPFIKVTDTAYPPFQLIFDEDRGIPSSVRLKEICNDVVHFTNYANTCTRFEKDVDNDGVSEWIYTFGGGFFDGVPPGTYYVEITFPDDSLMFTETFCHPGTGVSCGPNWHLEYSHSCDEKSLGEYSMNFLNKLNLGDVVLMRDGEVENSVTRKDGFGVETNIAVDLRPRYSFEILGCQWLLDSLLYLKWYDIINLKRSENDDVFRLYNIEATGLGDINSCLFPIKISFTKDVLVNTKCCESVYEQAPVPGNCLGMSVNLSPDFSLCLSDEAELQATVIGGAAPFVYIWSTGEFGDTITVAPDGTTTYIVTAIDAFGCTKQDSITITVIACEGELEVTITPDPVAAICVGASVDLDAEVIGGSGTYTYLWSTGATTQDITVSPTVTTIYSLTVTDTITGDVQVEMVTITVLQPPDVTIIRNGCMLSIQFIDECIDGEGNPGVQTFQWQIETAPDDWDPAPGTNTGSTYLGVTGENYRLAVTCEGCTGYSNELTAECSTPCVTEITSVVYDDVADELTVTYASTMGSNSFMTGYVTVNESINPGACPQGGGYQFVITVTIMASSGSVIIPYEPLNDPGCVFVAININAGECTDYTYQTI